MSKLITYLKSSGSLTVFNRKVTKRFLYIVITIIGLILLTVFWDKFNVIPQSFTTSHYWKEAF